jgi:hypothetical protein
MANRFQFVDEDDSVPFTDDALGLAHHIMNLTETLYEAIDDANRNEAIHALVETEISLAQLSKELGCKIQ